MVSAASDCCTCAQAARVDGLFRKARSASFITLRGRAGGGSTAATAAPQASPAGARSPDREGVIVSMIDDHLFGAVSPGADTLLRDRGDPLEAGLQDLLAGGERP